MLGLDSGTTPANGARFLKGHPARLAIARFSNLLVDEGDNDGDDPIVQVPTPYTSIAWGSSPDPSYKTHLFLLCPQLSFALPLVRSTILLEYTRVQFPSV